MNTTPMKVSINIPLVTNVNVEFDEEQFVLLAISGNDVKRYGFSPKHAKRLMLLLKKQIAAYEKKYGKLQTSLPEAKNQTTKKKEMGFAPVKQPTA